MKQLILCCILLIFSYSALAQEQATPRIIDLSSQLYGIHLASDGQTIATHEIAAIHSDEIIDELLPIRLFDVATGDQRAELSGATDYARDIAFSPDSTRLASYHPTGFVYVWDVENGMLLNEILTLPDGGQIRFMPDNRTLILSIANQLQPYLVFVDTTTGAISRVLMQRFANRQALAAYLDSVRAPGNIIAAFDVMPDSQAIVLATGFGDIKLWHIEQGDEIVLRTHEEDMPSFDIRALAALPDLSAIVYSHQREGALRMIDIEARRENTLAEGGIRAFAVAPNGNSVAWLEVSADTTSIHILSLMDSSEERQFTLTLPPTLNARTPTMTLAFTPDQQQMIVGGFANTESLENQIVIVDVG